MGPVVLGFIFAVFVSACFAFIERKDPKQRRKYFIKAFCYFFFSIFIAGWIMKFLPWN